ncbi:type 1 glutamine amidotransferase [Amycolatopsis nalaikhensis]|uniref:Lipid II isoglutaminyl synthase (glutamine-hydrolyzing) subunit GatD n=1 Tax=Amycolatopsis nalaikhensis TaxID=715472 RepID=A0ABY8XUB5_9PSEU|nr:glutamine amidotransferase [Amycolatopsis sp. 2-2]WIV59188.1 glutamine amidotransferase [Amycolatopsis sp. 2-2]
MAGESVVRIGLLLPDLLGTYGDCGNAEVLHRRLAWRDIPAAVVALPLGTAIPASLDVYLLGGGEDSAQTLAADALTRQPGLLRAVDRGAPVLAVCAGLQLLGQQFTVDYGRPRPGAGLLDLVTTAATHRAIGEVITQPEPGPLSEPLTGFENHQGHTELGPAARPLGRVIRGVGNGTGFDGIVQGRVIGTYLHGPVLARNPELADLLLSWVIGRPLSPVELVGLTDLRRQRLARYHRRQSWNDFRRLVGIPGRSSRRAASAAHG